jgi:hypothetical protein
MGKPVYSSVKIGAFDFEVVYQPVLIEEGQMARVLYAQGRIELRPGMSPEIERGTLLHEVIHAIWLHAGVGRPHDEQLLDITSNGILQVALANPELFD